MAHRECPFLVLATALAIGCSTTTVNTGGAGGDGGSATAGSGGATANGGSTGYGGSSIAGSGGATASGGSAGSGGSDASADGDSGRCFALTLLNYLSWCSVSVDGHAASSGTQQKLCVAGVVSLSTTPLAGFRLGTAPWHGTDGDQGSGEQGTVVGDTSTATVTVNGPKCVWVCCELATGGGCASTLTCPTPSG